MNIDLAKLVAADIRDALVFSESSEINQAPEYIDLCERVLRYDPLDFDMKDMRERIEYFLRWPAWPLGQPMRYSKNTQFELALPDPGRIAVSDAFVLLHDLLS